ncbi:hypothetical protein LTR78_005071 [Recurvomyces mirabilis]|uniref:Uncharacterized protein n=1 Tax=Recurvomyces mirabilis TaxID=574656 RepID=A0AAE0WNU6_9PEZI|nr:hypothetical protein LTR78_005071 [Recurvomyces mirabilis]KAK5158312.1 hypothetical protein LTS14_003330 [Recurvomyces mirabilis]
MSIREASMTEGTACRSNESKDNAFPNHDSDYDWIDEHKPWSPEKKEERGREVAWESAPTLPRTPSQTEHARGRHEHIYGSERRLEGHHERRHVKRSSYERLAVSHEHERVHQAFESPASPAASIATLTSTRGSEQERDVVAGYDSSPSDYSDIWNDYHSSSEAEDDGGADQDQEKKCEYEERQKTYDHLCARPPLPPPPPLTSVGGRYGDCSSWNARAFNLPSEFEDDSLLGGRDMITAFEPKDYDGR